MTEDNNNSKVVLTSLDEAKAEAKTGFGFGLRGSINGPEHKRASRISDGLFGLKIPGGAPSKGHDMRVRDNLEALISMARERGYKNVYSALDAIPPAKGK